MSSAASEGLVLKWPTTTKALRVTPRNKSQKSARGLSTEQQTDLVHPGHVKRIASTKISLVPMYDWVARDKLSAVRSASSRLPRPYRLMKRFRPYIKGRQTVVSATCNAQASLD